MFRIHLNETLLIADREPPPPGTTTDPEVLRNLREHEQPAHLNGFEWWPEVDATPVFNPDTHQRGGEQSIEVDAEEKLVRVVYAVEPIPAEVLEQRRRALVPQRVRLKQARLILIEDGLFDKVEEFIDGIADPKQQKIVRTQWEFSDFVERYKDLVLGIAQALQLSDAEVDNLFIRAEKIIE